MEQKKVGRFIAQCRKEKGFTQAQLAERFGVSNRAVSKWESGKCCPDASIMVELCEVLGITVNEMLSGEKAEKQKEKTITAKINVQELRNKLKSVKMRIVISNLLLLTVAVVSAFTVPIALLFIATIMTFRNYVLLGNMRKIKTEIKNNCKSEEIFKDGE